MLVRVLEIPEPTGHHHFAGGEPQTFMEVDWFRDDAFRDDSGNLDIDAYRERITPFIEGKAYFDPRKAYLLLSPEVSLTINYAAP